MTTIRSIHDDFDHPTTERDYTPVVVTGDDFNRLDEIVARLHPCSPPDVMNGYDLCPCGYGGTWPCAITEAAWLARGLNPVEEARRIMRDIIAPYIDGGERA